MIKVQLHELKFHAFHGIFEEEKILGNEYLVNASAEFHEAESVITSIQHTINYAEMYRIIKVRMQEPTPLLETLLMQIGNDIYKTFPETRSINISIQKMHPPIVGMEGSAIVSYHKEY